MKRLFCLIIGIVLPVSGVCAGEAMDKDCTTKASIVVADMGRFTESQLKAQINALELKLSRMRHKHGRGSQLARTHDSRDQLQLLQSALQEMNDQLYLAGCKANMQEVSQEARLEKLEKSVASQK